MNRDMNRDMSGLEIRRAAEGDKAGMWAIFEAVIRAGDTYALPRDLGEETAMAYWLRPAHEVYVAETDGRVVGTYFIRENPAGGGADIANCGYMTAGASEGRGVGRAMCVHSIDRARARGFRAMQYNFVASTNDRAVRLWQQCGFEIVGTLPGAFRHPAQGYVDAYIMYRNL
jgi:ribosomal protein S18 acetylase RimI-like enzyme